MDYITDVNAVCSTKLVVVTTVHIALASVNDASFTSVRVQIWIYAHKAFEISRAMYD